MKKREKFKLKGLQSNSIGKRGTMESMAVAHNVRIDENSMITTVCENRITDYITRDYGYSIKFCHSYIGAENYIAVKANEVHWVEVVEGEILSKAKLYHYLNTQIPNIEFDFFAYGNILYITAKNNGEPVEEETVNWDKNRYINLDVENIEPPKAKEITCKYLYSVPTVGTVPSLVVSVDLDTTAESNGLLAVNQYNYHYKEQIDKFNKLNYICGSAYLIFAYRLVDGTIIKNSGIHMIDNQIVKLSPKRSIYVQDEGSKVSFYMDMVAVMPTITFDVPQNVIDNPLIDSIVVYSSRNNMVYDFDNIYQRLNFSDPDQVDISLFGKDYTRISAKSVIDTKSAKVAHLPFYEIATIDFREKSDIELNFYDHYNNIEQAPIFKPNLSLHKIIGKNKYEYNSRLHLLGLNMEFFSGEVIPPGADSIITDDAIYNRNEFTIDFLIYKTTLEENNETFVCYKKVPISVYHSTLNYNLYILIPNMVTYPDVRAKKIDVYYETREGIIYFIKEFILTKAPENGLAYYQDLSTEIVASYHPFVIYTVEAEDLEPVRNRITFNNRIAVSHINNGYVFDYSNIIDIGNRNTVINGVDTIYHNFAETHFGSYPLYVFTNQGIFALESSNTTTSYSNIVPIDNQITDNYFHSISAGGVVFFITQRGIHSLRGTSCEYISNNIEKHYHAGIAFSDYLQNCELIYIPYYDEIAISNSKYPYCYIYSIKKEEFTTKDFGYIQISIDKVAKENGIYSIFFAENSTMPLLSFLESNAEMFGTMDRKRVVDFELSGEFKADARFVLSGSNNGTQWSAIKSINASEKRFKKASGSWRYLKYSLQSSFVELDAVEIEVESRKL